MEITRHRGRPPSSHKVHADRDRLIHFMVEWVKLKTGLGVGRGLGDPTEHDACVVTAWLLSGGRARADTLWNSPGRENLIEASRVDANVLQLQLAGVRELPVVLGQLRRVDHLSVRRAYLRVQSTKPWRPTLREDVRRAELTRQSLIGESPSDDPAWVGKIGR